MGWNHDMTAAPKDREILGLCRSECRNDHCGYHTGQGTTLCLYHAHAEGLSSVSDGAHVIEWGGGFTDTGEYGEVIAELPDWWFRTDSEFEAAANPVAWMEIPA
jgi:hypothetical protein